MLRRIMAGLIGFTLMWGALGTQKALSMGGTQFGTYSAAYIAKQKHKAEKHDCVWPKSECANGWVDRMTGCCPSRK